MSQTESSQGPDYVFKLLLVGNAGVGKSCLLQQYTDQTFVDKYIPTIGVDFITKTIESGLKKVKLQVWDTASQERFRSMLASYYKGSHAVIVVYDVTDQDSFRDVSEVWLKQVNSLASDNAVRVLVGAKSDLADQRKVTTDDAKMLAEKHQMSFYEVSSKSVTNVGEVFQTAAQKCVESVNNGGCPACSSPAKSSPAKSSPGVNANTSSSASSVVQQSNVATSLPEKSSKPEYDHLLKLLLIGNSNVGKSCLILKYADDAFSDDYVATIGVDFRIRTIELDGKTVKLQMWDTAGEERFRTITASYYRGAHVIFIVYDIADADSFNDVGEVWLNEVQRHANETVVRVLVGCKSDASDRRAVKTEDGKELASRHQMPFFEVSAKSGKMVEEMFHGGVREFLKLDAPERHKAPASARAPQRSRACLLL